MDPRPCTVRYRHVARLYPAGTRVRIDAELFPTLATGTVRAKGTLKADIDHERATCVLPGMLAVTPDKTRTDGHAIDCVALWPHEVSPLSAAEDAEAKATVSVQGNPVPPAVEAAAYAMWGIRPPALS